MERMKNNLNPLFSDITWGAGGSTADLSLELALNMHKTGHVGKFNGCLSYISALFVSDTVPRTSIDISWAIHIMSYDVAFLDLM